MTLALVGAGHAHLYLLTQAEAYRRRNIRVVLIDPGRFWYSGLATGMLSGRNSADEDQLDVAALCRTHGIEHWAGRVRHIDLLKNLLHLDDGLSLGFDRLSLNLGSEVPTPPWVRPISTWTVKPIPRLYELRQHLEQTMKQQRFCPPVVVAGGGVTGIEVAAAIAALARRAGCKPDVTLVGRDPQLAPRLPSAARAALSRHLLARGVRLVLSTALSGQDDDAVFDDAGTRWPCAELVFATGLVAHPLTQTLGLEADPVGGLKVQANLDTPSNHHVFAVGDCAHFLPRPLPKVGVYGVRAAPVLHRNLLASFDGLALEAFKPQERYLSIINLGDGNGLAVHGSLWWRGRISQCLKDGIDQRFMRGYRRLILPGIGAA